MSNDFAKYNSYSSNASDSIKELIYKDKRRRASQKQVESFFWGFLLSISIRKRNKNNSENNGEKNRKKKMLHFHSTETVVFYKSIFLIA